MKRSILILIVAVVGLTGCTKRPEIPVEKVKADIIGRTVGEGLLAPTFKEDSLESLTVVEVIYKKNKAEVVVDVDYRVFPVIQAGRLRLNYVWIPEEWSLLGIDNLSFKPGAYQDRVKETMGDMRTLATALEAYATDHGDYPNAESIEDLCTYLSPIYLRDCPEEDAWGNRYQFKVAAGGTDYWLRSTGLDGKKTPLTAGSTHSFDADVVASDGAFVSYPGK